jgi:hypothetical protein
VITAYDRPRRIVRGVPATLTLELYDDDGETPLTPTGAGTFTLYSGSTALVTGRAVTLGASSTVGLLLADTDGKSLTDNLLEVWSFTDVDGQPEVVRRHAHLVRHQLFPTVRISDLDALHAGLSAKIADLGTKIRDAFGTVERDLMNRGNRVHLICDSWKLFEQHRRKTLEIAFRDAKHAVNDRTWAELAESYGKAYRDGWSEEAFSAYDWAEDGTISSTDTKPAEVGVIFTSRPPVGFGGR